MSIILSIETSCDETAVALVRSNNEVIEVLGDAVASQIDIHSTTGGVIPEVAAREHVNVIRPMLEGVLDQAGIEGVDVDGIAVTVGPGLMPSLSVGVQAARALAYAWKKPIVPIHHIEGHIYSALCNSAEENRKKKTENRGRVPFSFFHFPFSNVFPALALIVSGGHTLLIRMNDHLKYKVLGSTRDDAAGEAFDKVARIINLPYPGGPYVAALAGKGDASTMLFPVPMIHSEDLDFSFSGLKTAVLYKVRELSTGRPPDKGGTGGSVNVQTLSREKANIAASFQEAVVNSLIGKTRLALEEHEYKILLLAGGVAANKLLRERFGVLGEEFNIQTQIAPISLCSDNAVMIGLVGVLACEAGRTATWQEVDARARINIERVSVPDAG